MPDEQLKTLNTRLRGHLYGSMEEPLELAFKEEIDQFSRSEFIAGIFTINKSSVSQNILVNMHGLMQSVSYADLLDAFVQMADDELAVYHYAAFLPRIFGVDPYGMAEENPSLQSAVDYIRRSLKRGSIAPDDWSEEYLSDRDISQAELLERMKKQGAPMVNILF